MRRPRPRRCCSEVLAQARAAGRGPAGGAGGRAAGAGARTWPRWHAELRTALGQVQPRRGQRRRPSPGWPTCTSGSGGPRSGSRRSGSRSQAVRRQRARRGRGARGAGGVRPGVGDADPARAGAGGAAAGRAGGATTGPRARWRSPSTPTGIKTLADELAGPRQRSRPHDDAADGRVRRSTSAGTAGRPQGAAAGPGAAAGARSRAGCRGWRG